MKSGSEKPRSLALDCSRIIAVLFVVMIHTAMHFVKFEINSLSYLYGNIFDGLARAGVPLFVMVSGALMLDEKKEIPVKKVFSKYILNVVLLFVSWSFIYMIWTTTKSILEGNSVGFGSIIKELISGGFHMWYLIMIIGLYLIIPILKLFVKKENSGKIAYIILVSLLFTFFPVLLTCLSEFSRVFNLAYGQLARFEYGFIGVFATYFITGWYVNHIGVKYKKIVYLLAVISVLFIIVLVQLTGNHSEVYSNSNILVYLYSLGIFTFINDICRNKVSPGIVKQLSNLTFGVYIIHIIVLQVINIFFDNTQITPFSIMIRFGLISVISFIGSYIISKIPGIRKLVRF